MSKGRQESQTQVSFSHLVISHLIILRPFSFVFFPLFFFSFYLSFILLMFSVHISRLVIFAICIFFFFFALSFSVYIVCTTHYLSPPDFTAILPFLYFFVHLVITSSYFPCHYFVPFFFPLPVFELRKI